MTSTISFRIDKELLQDITNIERTWKTDRSEVMRRLLHNAVTQWKIADALSRLHKQEITPEQAAKELNTSVWKILSLSAEKNINWTGYGDEDLAKDLAVLGK